jgi:hypothetical protein
VSTALRQYYTCALAFKVLESPEGEVIEINSQEELAQVMKAFNLSYDSPIYLMIPTNASEQDVELGNYGQMCLSCACNTQHMSEPKSNSCCIPNCASQHPGSYDQNDCVWSYKENRWYSNQCRTL